jgi:hypothetical protein
LAALLNKLMPGERGCSCESMPRRRILHQYGVFVATTLTFSIIRGFSYTRPTTHRHCDGSRTAVSIGLKLPRASCHNVDCQSPFQSHVQATVYAHHHRYHHRQQHATPRPNLPTTSRSHPDALLHIVMHPHPRSHCPGSA